MFNKLKTTIRRLINHEIIDVIKANDLAIRYNNIFQDYRGLYEGKDVFIVGCGPSEKYFNPTLDENRIYIGINRAFRDNRFSFDYLFAQDQMEEGMGEFLSYRDSCCTKFLAIIPHEDADFRISDCNSNMRKSLRYALAGKRMGSIPVDITVEPIADLCGTVFSAIQFALFTNPKHIYLIGFDCSEGNSFKKSSANYDYQLEGWHRIKCFIDAHKRKDIIISINPIGLKGMFNDMYTEEFLSDKGMTSADYRVFE